MKSIIRSVIIIPTIFLASALAQSENSCIDPNTNQFDFWIGEWNISWVDQDGNTRNAKNIVTKILGGCVVEENFTFSDGSFAGKSFSVYNPNLNLWEQTWVDNSGNFMNFTGGLDGDKMILSRKATNKEGKEIIQRMVFYDISLDELKWNWERSINNGQSWDLMWRLNYARQK